MKEQIAKFTLSIPKNAKRIAKFVSTSPNHPALNMVAIIPEWGFLIATDKYVLQRFNVECRGKWPQKAIQESNAPFNVLIDPKILAQLAGRVITVTVFQYTKMVEVIKNETARGFSCTQKTTKPVKRTFNVAEIECGDNHYSTEFSPATYPDIRRVMPQDDTLTPITISSSTMKTLKNLCKMHRDGHLSFAVNKGSRVLNVLSMGSTLDEFHYKLLLEKESPMSEVFCFSTDKLLTILEQGITSIKLREGGCYNYPAKISEGNCDMLLMPMTIPDYEMQVLLNSSCTEEQQCMSDVDTSLKYTLTNLQEEAQKLWSDIITCNSANLKAGTYSAKDISDKAKAKCGKYDFPNEKAYSNYTIPLEILHGSVNLASISYQNLFTILSKWEVLTKEKSKFIIPESE